LPGLLIILFFGPSLFGFVFGEEWKESGVFSQILICMFVLKLIVSPLSYAYFIKNKLKEDFMIHVWMLFSSIIIFRYGFILDYNYTFIIFGFSINYSIIYLFTIMRSFKFSKNIKRHNN
jgi:O-antigen/teichoic acid export membrane protein